MKPEPDRLLCWDARDEMESILYAHIATRTAIQLIATNPDLGPAIETQFLLNAGFPQGTDANRAQRNMTLTIEEATKIVESDFQYLRRSSLIGLCASFEHLMKCLLVDWADFMPDRISGLDRLKISLQASDFLDSDERDRLFLIADKAYQEAQPAKGYADKVQFIIKTYLPEQIEVFTTKADSINCQDFNEAFLVRNCLVHHGAKVNRPLSRRNGFAFGAPIVLSTNSIQRYFQAIRGFGDALSACVPYAL